MLGGQVQGDKSWAVVYGGVVTERDGEVLSISLQNQDGEHHGDSDVALRVFPEPKNQWVPGAKFWWFVASAMVDGSRQNFDKIIAR